MALLRHRFRIAILESVAMKPNLLLAIRIVLALVWLYNGLWLKVILVDAHHLQIVRSVLGNYIDPVVGVRLIGSCETLLGIGILSGLFSRFVSIFQIIVILAMNVCGSLFGGGAIAHPVGLLISNLPTLMCAAIIAAEGPGAYAITWQKFSPQKIN
jgi:uncharacterized membrane protein YphA (DoxX/SURF4 family)